MAALTNADDEVELLGAALAGTEALLDRTIAQALEEADQDRAREQRVDDEPSPAEKQPDEPPSQPSRALLHNVQASHDAAARHREDALQKAVAFRDDWRRRRAVAEARPPPPRPPRRRKPPEAPAKDNNGIAGAQLRGVAAAGATILAGAVAGPGRRPIPCRGDGVLVAGTYTPDCVYWLAWRAVRREGSTISTWCERLIVRCERHQKS